jgi:hypothetical protein
VVRAWAPTAIGLNIEDVVTDRLDLSQVAARVRPWEGEILMPTLPWIQNGQGWGQLQRCVAALEIFPDENEASKRPQDCVDHAFAEGLTKVTLMYKTKPPNRPEQYDFSLCHSLYTADDITPTREAWTAWEHRGEERPAMPSTTQTRRATSSRGDANWHKKRYPASAAPLELAFPRPLFPPDSKAQRKTPSPPGPDVLAYKRAVCRAQRWGSWNPSGWDDSYSNAFAHGKSTGIIDDSGVAGFQAQAGIKPTGWIGESTFEALCALAIPNKPRVQHAGEPLFDAECIRLLKLAAAQFSKAPPDVDDIRAAIAEFCEKAEANEANWHYSQNRPVTLDVNPSGSSITSDCSGFVIQAYRYAHKTTGLAIPDPALQNWTGFGNTDLHEDNHPRVTDGQYQVGDLAHYRGHVTICRKAGDASRSVWTSHGQEAGPDPVTLHYRSDFRFVVRPPLLFPPV